MPVIFSVDKSVFTRHPNYVVGCVLARGIRASDESSAIENELANAERTVAEHFGGRDPKDDPAIAVWRNAFSASGWSASKYPASIEALVKRIAKGGTVPRINLAVDLANAAALRFLVPVGAQDVASLGSLPL